MRHPARWRTGAAVLTGSLLAVLPAVAFGPVPDASRVRLLDLEQAGNLVAVTLLGTGSATVSGAVVLQVVFEGGTTTVMALPFTVRKGQQVTIRAVHPGPAGLVVPAGIIVDDGPPF